MKNIKTPLIIILVIGLLVVIKFTFFTTIQVANFNSKSGQEQAGNVTVYSVKPEKLDNRILATGTILANEEVDLKAEASGRIVQLLFQEGNKVSKGDLLVKLNDADLTATLKKLEYQEKLAEEKLARIKKLLEIKGVSQEEYDAIVNQYEGLKADIDFTHAQIAKTEIHAPFAGTIGLKSVSEGSYVSPTIKIASIQQIDPVKIDFSIPEKYAPMIHKGNKVIFHIQERKEEFVGEIYAIEPKIDLATRTLQLRAICPNKQGMILPGSFARIELLLQESVNSILIPTEALIPELKGQKVFLYKNGKAQSQKVETGTRTEKQIEITTGLKMGDTIITTGIMQLKPGSAVKIIEIK